MKCQKDEMGGTCGMYGEKKNTRGFWLVSLNEGGPVEYIGMNRRVTLI
jgi:hypothetical protein